MTEAEEFLMSQGFHPHNLITNHKGERKLFAGVMIEYAEKYLNNISERIKLLENKNHSKSYQFTDIERKAIKFLKETDTMQFSTFELLTMFYEHQKKE
tara:strand:- start:5320 stop:5613 length:294 start_codon:yes stop_codon:yes gene_type:complete